MSMSSRFHHSPAATKVAIVGIGSMGTGLAYQAEVTAGTHCAALADIDPGRAIACADLLGRSYRVVNSSNEAEEAIHSHSIAIATDANLLADCPGIEVLVESSSDIAAGGQYAERFLSSGKHVVMMNAEADLIFGPYLSQLGARHQAVYTSTDGDQHGVIMRLVDELREWNLELVMAGNIKGFLDRSANPTTIIPEAKKRNYTPKMTAGYTDGSKLCIEMALVANALGLSTPAPGMTGPSLTHVREVLDHFDFDAVRRAGPIVDYVLGAEPNGGVFAVAYCDNAYQRSMLSTLKMGDGPYYVLYRPYHLCHVEAMSTVKRAAQGIPLLQPEHGFRTNVFAYAKIDLRAGDRLDGVGGYCCYGLIENCEPAPASPGLPLCLSDALVMTRDRRPGERLAWDDVVIDPHTPAFRMYAKALDASAASRPAASAQR
jgi:predicted homoserine dehydrogenase-like protein